MDNLEQNKATAKAFYSLMFNHNEPEKAIELYTGQTYIQHNPHVPDGKAGFISYFKKMAVEFPGKKVHFKRAFAEGDHVILHCFQEWPGDKNYASIDIFRFDTDGKIVEHWDVLQVIPEKAVHNNTMF